MAPQRNMVWVLAALVGVAVAANAVSDAGSSLSSARDMIWAGFFFGVPVVLAGLLMAGKRWALMAGVMYGTIGLALDISTIVQEITKSALPRTLLLSGVSGLLNFLLIVIGGRGFLDVLARPTPPADRPPNLRFP